MKCLKTLYTSKTGVGYTVKTSPYTDGAFNSFHLKHTLKNTFVKICYLLKNMLFIEGNIVGLVFIF